MSDTPAPGATGSHPLAPDHLPYFIPAADGSDAMFGHVIVFIIVGLFAGGTLYLRLHALPERMAHGASRTQLQLVAILALIALFTHEAIFWIVALLLAATQLPDFLTPITSGARSLAKMSERDYEGDFDEADDTGSAPPAAPSHAATDADTPAKAEG